MKQLYHWLSTHLQTWYGTLAFMVLVATEGFFIIPVSALLAFFCLENRSKAFTYATLATSLTGLGALIGYGIGYLLYTTGSSLLLEYVVRPEAFQMLASRFEEYQTFSSFAVALSPVPYKTLTITAGFLRVPLFPFIPLSIVARGVRFFAIASAVHFWGNNFKYIIDRYFYWVLGLGSTVVVAVWYFLR